jgi:hypothetical protein
VFLSVDVAQERDPGLVLPSLGDLTAEAVHQPRPVEVARQRAEQAHDEDEGEGSSAAGQLVGELGGHAWPSTRRSAFRAPRSVKRRGPYSRSPKSFTVHAIQRRRWWKCMPMIGEVSM